MAKLNGSPKFEDAFKQLRVTVDQLESGNLSLEESTRLFEAGIQLAKQCNQLLSKAELTVSKLQHEFGEQIALLQSTQFDRLPPAANIEEED